MSNRTIQNERLLVTISDYGAELSSIYDKQEEREVLWQGDSKFWDRHAPVLFPNVGRHWQNQYRIGGQTYQSKQHGFARDTEFTCVAYDEISVTHRINDTEETLKVFPYAFTLEITHRLVGNELKVFWKVVNRSEEIMYFTIGGHPGFNVPILAGTERSDYKLLFEREQQFMIAEVDYDSGTVWPERRHALPVAGRYLDIAGELFDNDALVFDNSQIAGIAICYPDGSPYIGMRCPGFTNFGVWTLPGAPYVCLEPWMGRCDNHGFDQDISRKPDVIKLAGNGTFEQGYEIIVH